MKGSFHETCTAVALRASTNGAGAKGGPVDGGNYKIIIFVYGTLILACIIAGACAPFQSITNMNCSLDLTNIYIM